MDRPDRGQITVDGEEISNLDEHGMSLYRSSTIGIVFQQFHLVPHLTALENVMLPLQIAGKQDGGKAMAALDAMALGHRARHLPGELSGGECQRVAMARALISEPKLLLADEPSGNLDSKTGQQVMDVLFERVEALGTTLMLVTHHEPLSQRCQRTLRMEAGLLQGQD
jgi:putative ABC transport system ATP-binding protein